MYVKVVVTHDARVLRADNGQYVGKRVSLGSNDCSFVTKDGNYISITYGYIVDGCLVKLCQETTCSYKCLEKCNPDCRYAKKAYSTGFYYKIN